MFDGENFEYMKDKIKLSYLSYGIDLWDIVEDTYAPLVNGKGVCIPKRKQHANQKKKFSMYPKARLYLRSTIAKKK